MEVQERNSNRIYTLTSNPALPAWIPTKQRRNLSKTSESYRHRIELLQDFTMPCSSTRIVPSRNGRYLFACGTYKPRIKCYDLPEMSMKFERYLDSEPLDMVMLGEDYGKFAVLGADRSVSFHAPYGVHDKIRIPRFGRGMDYDTESCDLYVVASGNDIYRFNLEEGRYQQPCEMGGGFGGTCMSISPSHALLSVGGEDGMVRFYDQRVASSSVKPFINLNVGSALADDVSKEISSLAYDSTGMHMAVGTQGGNVALYDMRSSQPLLIKEHPSGLPIKTVQFHKSSRSVISCDPKIVKIWKDGRHAQDEMGSIVANIEGNGDFTHLMVCGDQADPKGHSSGLILCASEKPEMQAFYCPALGSVPKWCSFLENITEELEENTSKNSNETGAPAIYDDYKFITRDEVDTLNISNLIGTQLLKGYMHGFFINIGLYNRVRAVAKPFEYQEYKKNKLKEKIAEKQKSRITPKQKRVKVNQHLIDHMEEKMVKMNKKGKVAGKAVLEDNRFQSLFENTDFEIDEQTDDYKLRNPSANWKKKSEDMDSDQEMESEEEEEDDDDVAEEAGFTRVQNDDQEKYSSDDDSDSDSDEDGFAGAKVRGEEYDQISPKPTKKNKKRPQPTAMYEADDYGIDTDQKALRMGLGDTSAMQSRKEEISLPLEERIKRQNEMELSKGLGLGEAKRNWGGEEGVTRELRYVPKDARKKEEVNTGGGEVRGGKRNRRGVKELGFKKPYQKKR